MGIIEAVQSLCEGKKAKPIGTKIRQDALPRNDALAKVKGEAAYAGDVAVLGMLHAAVLYSPHAHAAVKTIDTSSAQVAPGVRGVVVLLCMSPSGSWRWATQRIVKTVRRKEAGHTRCLATLHGMCACSIRELGDAGVLC